ncbi:hypothetical protein MMC22_000047 [Lobaria immixta]|nr:hypothetical protein [Lobaria immixta]
MSDNYDFLPATTAAHSNPTRHDQAAPIQDIVRDVIRRRERIQRQLAMERQNVTNSPEGFRPYFVRDSSHQRRGGVWGSQASGGPGMPEFQAPTSALRSRPQAIPSERYLRGAHHRRHDRPNFSGNAGTIQQEFERLNEASSSLSSLLDQPMPRLNSPDADLRPYSGDAELHRRRPKRRKLDGDFKAFSYGYRGQVVPGALKMEIVSCDGGLHAESRHGRQYWPENVLRNDKSVYCTDSSKCNIIMRHQGETPFCLKKLVIKAPERGFTAPIQEGLIFISMNSDDLIARTAQYQVQEASTPRAISPENLTHSGRSTTPHVTSREPNENRPPSRRTNDAAVRTVPPPISNTITYTNVHRALSSSQSPPTPNAYPFSHLDLGEESSLPPRTITPPTPLSFAISTDCSDHSSDEEEESSAATLADRLRRDHLPLPPSMDSSSDSTEDGDLSHWATPRARTATRHRRNRRQAIPSRIEVAAPSTAEEARNGTDGRPPVEVLAPHARFFIEREKSMISIKFEPLVSGRFILLKLWSPAENQNIDIQSIVAHGFAGPRFFPAVQTT